MTALHSAQLFDFDGMIDHGAADANQCANFFDGVGPLLEGTQAGWGSFPAACEADVRALTTNMDAALSVPKHRWPDGDDEINHPCVSQCSSFAADENFPALS
jgi:hypothetical protein